MRLVTLAIAAVGVLMALAAAQAPTVATAVEPAVVGIDVDPSGNSPTSLGTIDNSRRVTGGETFNIDLFVQNVQAIHGFHFTLDYRGRDDRDIFRVTGVDVVNQMLGANNGSIVSDISDDVPDSNGFYGAAGQDQATDSSAAESGNGVLARVTLQAMACGESDLSINLQAEGVSPVLTDLNGEFIPPHDEFVFTGTVLDATVSVDEPCEPAPPPTDGQPGDSAPPAGDSGTPAGNSGTPAGDSGTPSSGQPTPTPAANETPTHTATASSTPTLTPGVLGATLPSTGGGEIDDGTSGSALTFLIVGGTLVLLGASSLIWRMRQRIVK